MKKLALSAVASLALATASLAQTVNITNGWVLRGATEQLNVASYFGDPSKVSIVWAWDETTSSWRGYSPVSTIQSQIPTSQTLSTIAAGNGFWVKGNTQASLTASSGSSSQTPYTGSATIDYDYSVHYFKNTSIPFEVKNVPSGSTIQWSVDGVDVQGATSSLAFLTFTNPNNASALVVAKINGTSGPQAAINLIATPTPQQSVAMTYGDALTTVPSTMEGRAFLLPHNDQGYTTLELSSSGGTGTLHDYKLQCLATGCSFVDDGGGTFSWSYDATSHVLTATIPSQNGTASEVVKITLTNDAHYVKTVGSTTTGTQTSGLVERTIQMESGLSSDSAIEWEDATWLNNSGTTSVTTVAAFAAKKMAEKWWNSNGTTPYMIRGSSTTATSGDLVEAFYAGVRTNCTSTSPDDNSCQHYVAGTKTVGTWSIDSSGVMREIVTNDWDGTAYRFNGSTFQQGWYTRTGVKMTRKWYTGVDAATMKSVYDGAALSSTPH